ncbi:protein kinase [Trypanosoma brucei equiperdum]|uniref:non-specific serine/threonine protein kinase n=1 Tax=Trypanosoma brucei equiperdum TaxID=630700 RepID=A0A3L6L552_9TRYP|nr:protein kinase [Trypanosoma brucei equiperdum]
MEDYTIYRPIGSGAQGSVLSVIHVRTGRKFAMKVIRCHDISSVNAALKEIKVLLQLRYPHIVSYKDFFLVSDANEVRRLLFEFPTKKTTISTDSQGYSEDMPVDAVGVVTNNSCGDGKDAVEIGPNEICVCLVMELCTYGDLGVVISKSKRSFVATGFHPISERRVVLWMKQCVLALKFIHRKGFLHRDLKPTNIFLDEGRNVKIGDFGLAVAVGMSQEKVVGTPLYIAPEHMLQEEYDGKVDVWGLGVVMLELTTLQEQPINSRVIENPSIVEKVVKQVTDMGFSGHLGELLRDMLYRSPDDRPSLEDISCRLDAMLSAVVQSNGITTPSAPRCATPSSLAALLSNGCDTEHMASPTNFNGVQSCKKDSEKASRSRRSCSSLERTPYSVTCSGRSTRTHWLRDESGSAMRLVKWRASSASSTSSRFLTPRRISCGDRSGLSPSPHIVTPLFDFFARGAGRNIKDTTIRVPRDYPTLQTALQAVKGLSHVRNIVVKEAAVFTDPLVLGADLPDSLSIIGEDPLPIVEVSDGPFAIHCIAGRGTIENFVIRHIARQTKKEYAVEPAEANDKADSHFGAISLVGGEWKISRCRISSSNGSGITVNSDVDAIVSHCHICDTKTAGVVVLEGAHGLFEKNTVKNCKLAGFLLKKDSTACVKRNDVVDGGVTGIFLHNAHGTVEENHIANNGSFGVVAKGPCANAVLKRNHITANQKAGVFCCSEAAPIIVENEIRRNNRAGILIKERASPNVSRNIIRQGREAGIYVFQEGAGVIEENEVLNNYSAGIIVTSNSRPHVMRNKIHGNRYEGVWVCKGGGGTYLQNDLRGNKKGAKDIEESCSVHWIENREV